MIGPSCCFTRQYDEGPTSTISGGSEAFPGGDTICSLFAYALFGYISQDPHEVRISPTLRVDSPNSRIEMAMFHQEKGAHCQNCPICIIPPRCSCRQQDDSLLRYGMNTQGRAKLRRSTAFHGPHYLCLPRFYGLGITPDLHFKRNNSVRMMQGQVNFEKGRHHSSRMAHRPCRFGLEGLLLPYIPPIAGARLCISRLQMGTIVEISVHARNPSAITRAAPCFERRYEPLQQCVPHQRFILA